MVIVYRDEIGFVEINLNTRFPVTFFEGDCYFTSEDGIDYKIPMYAVESIGIPSCL